MTDDERTARADERDVAANAREVEANEKHRNIGTALVWLFSVLAIIGLVLTFAVLTAIHRSDKIDKELNEVHVELVIAKHDRAMERYDGVVYERQLLALHCSLLDHPKAHPQCAADFIPLPPKPKD